MSQSYPPPPPPPPMGYAQPGAYAPQRTSAAAITSLVCGILGCLIIPGLIAIVTGIIGMRATRNPNVKGRGLAIAGLILGIIGVIGGGGCLAAGGGAAYWGYKQYAPAVESMTAFADAASKGDVTKAMNYVDASKVSRTEVDSVIGQLRTLGEPTKVNPRNPNIQNTNGTTTVDLDVTLEYPNNVSKDLSIQLTRQADGTFKASKLNLR